jgi:hypothetical protein
MAQPANRPTGSAWDPRPIAARLGSRRYTHLTRWGSGAAGIEIRRRPDRAPGTALMAEEALSPVLLRHRLLPQSLFEEGPRVKPVVDGFSDG